MMKTILVLNTNNNLGHQVVTSLLKNNYDVQLLAAETKHFSASESITQLPIDLAVTDTLKPEYFSQINQIIFCLENNNFFTSERLTNLIQAASHLPSSTENILFDFTNPKQEVKSMWGAVDDVVMGGVSQSNFQLADKQAIFTGYVSTDNNGGFASVRTRNFDFPLDLSDYQGIELCVKGDGKRYKFITRCEGKWDGISYNYSFDTIYDFPTTIQIPFTELRPVFRAKTVTEAGDFDSSKVYSLQLMLSKFEYDGQLNSKFEPGNFSLAIESIKAYGSPAKPQLIVVNSGVDRTVEQIICNSQIPYAIVRNSSSPEMPANRIFNLQELNLTQNDTNIDSLVELAIKSLESPEAVNKIWQIAI